MESNTLSLIEHFPENISYFKKDSPFSGPSEYFYLQIIKRSKHLDYERLFDEQFIELLYATLASWGMHKDGSRE